MGCHISLVFLILVCQNLALKLHPRRIDSHVIVPLNGVSHTRCNFPLRRQSNMSSEPQMGKGLCMFQWECRFSGGTPINVCRNGYQFGVCCDHEQQNNEVNNNNNNQPSPTSSVPLSTPTTTTTTTTTTHPEFVQAIDLHTKQKCGLPHKVKQQTARIVNGSKAAVGEFPWVVSVRAFGEAHEGFKHHCGGVILNEYWVLTAAHCIVRKFPLELQVRVGEHDQSFSSKDYPHFDIKVKSKHLHPKYDFKVNFQDLTYEHDIALLKLKRPIPPLPHVAPICLPQLQRKDGIAEGTIVGWGKTGENENKTSDVLRKARVSLIPNSKCEALFTHSGHQLKLPDSFLCAGWEMGGVDACNGDSGGPLQMQAADGRVVIVGVVSWGDGCGRPNRPGVYTRVHNYVKWILSHVTKR